MGRAARQPGQDPRRPVRPADHRRASPTSRRPAAGRRPDDRPAEHGRLARARPAVGGHRAATGPPTRPRPDVPWSETVIAEVHVRGFTKLHPDVPPEQRGTYLGLAHPAVVEHLRRIGVTAVELLPVTAIADEPPLLATRACTNYWGYSTLGFFAPHPGYASVPGAEIEEFRTMVDALHAAGIEVILDVVPNHTCEGGVGGTTISFRGLDAPAYYCLRGRLRRRHHRHRQHPRLRLADGRPAGVRRAAATGRPRSASTASASTSRACSAGPRSGPFDPHAPLLTAIAADPVLVAVQADRRAVGRHRRGLPGRRVRRRRGRSGTAATATPSATSGAGHGGDRRGGLAADRQLRPLRPVRCAGRGRRSTSSPPTTGSPCATSSSYERKHNEANGEDNRDGTDDNRSQNFGVEGETTSPVIRARRLGHGAGAARARCCCRPARRCCWAATSCGAPRAATTTPTACDDDTSWVDWSAGPRRSADGVRRAAGGDPPLVADPAPRPLLPRRRGARGGTSRAVRWASATGTTHGTRIAGPAASASG